MSAETTGPTRRLRLALAQLDPTVGDVRGNAARALEARRAAAADGADLIVFPELFLVGYPPEDLVLRPSLLDAVERALDELAKATAEPGPAILIPAPSRSGERVHNSVFLLTGGAQTARRDKYELPNYGVFDEKRVFTPTGLPEPIPFGGWNLGVPICEDIWFATVPRRLKEGGADILIVPNGSPFELGKVAQRLAIGRRRIAETGLPLVYLNQIGGQDELVFDGGSFVLDAVGDPVAALPAWQEAVVTLEFRDAGNGPVLAETHDAAVSHLTDRVTAPESQLHLSDAALAEIYAATVLGLRDYVGKNRFPGVVLGLSGGIDSALTAAIAVDALGPDKVHCVRLPSRFTSAESQDDAEDVARLLGIELSTLPIGPSVTALEATLEPLFAGKSRDITEENLQARIRGVLLMGLSNKFGWMLVTTGNKSEMSVGYATLYGDMCGGYSVLKDIYKTTVFALSRWRNAHRPHGALGPAGTVIPECVIVKPPTAELRENQTDQDSLPPYEELDGILMGLVEGEQSVDEIAANGYARDTVRRVQQMLYLAEYKRRQAPPGVKISPRNLSRDRRYPITNAFRDRQT